MIAFGFNFEARGVYLSCHEEELPGAIGQWLERHVRSVVCLGSRRKFSCQAELGHGEQMGRDLEGKVKSSDEGKI